MRPFRLLVSSPNNKKPSHLAGIIILKYAKQKPLLLSAVDTALVKILSQWSKNIYICAVQQSNKTFRRRSCFTPTRCIMICTISEQIFHQFLIKCPTQRHRDPDNFPITLDSIDAVIPEIISNSHHLVGCANRFKTMQKAMTRLLVNFL